MADLKKELGEFEKDLRSFLAPRLIVGALLVVAAAVYIFWPHHG
jgi:hypothetical protein